MSSVSAESPAGLVPEYHLTRERLRTMYATMVLARKLEERMLTLQRQGQAPFIIAGVGQEAAQVGAGMALQVGTDYIAPYYRDLAMNLVFGMTAREAMLNCLAKIDDPNSFGRQMPAHWGHRARHVVTQSSVVATQLLHATGLALAAKMRNDPIVVLTSCGEGSTSRGDFHEAMNFAAIHKLPVIFFIENNGYAITEKTEKAMATEHVADRAAGYGLRGQVVDGMDVVAVYHTVKAVADQARRGQGPYLIEAKCYRLWPHSSDDDDTRYRPKAELEEWSRKDPITVFRDRLIEDNVFSEEELAAIDAQATEDVRDAAQWALAQPDPKPEDALGFVFKEAGDA